MVRSNGLVFPSLVSCALGCGSVRGDAQPDAASDAPHAVACDDGVREPGEVCYRTAVVVNATDVALSGRLGDADGDGDRDLIYLIGDQIITHINAGGAISPTGLPGGTTFSAHLIVEDLDGDSDADPITQGDGAYEIWRGDGNANHARTGSVMAGAKASGVVLADVNGVAPREVIALYGSTVVIGAVGPGLSLTQVDSRGVTGAKHVAAGRIDGDALADAVVATAGGIQLLRGTAANTFSSVTLTTPVIASTEAVALGDINADANLDVFYAAVSGEVGVMQNAGAAAFLAARPRSLPGARPVVAVADLDGDGRSDLIAASSIGASHAIHVLLGQADGSLGAPVSFPLAVPVDSLFADGDFNGDGAPDLVATSTNAQLLVLLPSGF